MQKKIRVLFLQSQAQTWSWSIANVHRMLLQHFDRERVEIYAACAIGVGVEERLLTPCLKSFLACICAQQIFAR